jgi:transposase-like protein
MESGELTAEQITKECGVSTSLLYKWRRDVAQHRAVFGAHPENSTFDEIVLDQAGEALPDKSTRAEPIRLRGDVVDLTLPAAYPVEDLAKLIRALEQVGR